MSENQKQFKRPPKRYQPRGLAILYEDRDILVVDKVSGLLTVGSEQIRDNTAYYRLTDYARKGNPKSRQRIFIVHRLDRDTSGVIVFAKSMNAKRFLQDEWPKFQKKYYAVVRGRLREKQGVISSHLAESSVHKMYSVGDPARGKLAETGYKVLRESPMYSLLEIDLLTGRKNQIRVHLSDRGCPVVGDEKYGVKEKGIRRLTLHAASITIRHPHSKEKMTFETKVPAYFEALMKRSRGTSEDRRPTGSRPHGKKPRNTSGRSNPMGDKKGKKDKAKGKRQADAKHVKEAQQKQARQHPRTP